MEDHGDEGTPRMQCASNEGGLNSIRETCEVTWTRAPSVGLMAEEE